MNHVSATIGIRAVDPRMLADDKFLKRMGNFERVCKQIDAKHDHVMEMLANIQEQLRKLEMKQRKERGAQFQIHTTAFKPPYLPVSRPQEIEVESKILPPNQCLSSLSYGSNDAEPEIEGFVEVVKHAPIISTVAVETDSSTTKATEIHERKVFDEMPESEKSKISGILPPFILGSEIAEICDFSVSSPQSQTPLASTQEIKMELDCLSLIPSPISFSPSSDDTKLKEEGSVEVPIYTIVTEWQPQEQGYGFEVSPKPTLVASKSIASIGKVEALPWPLMVSRLELSPADYDSKKERQLNYEKACREKFATPEETQESEPEERDKSQEINVATSKSEQAVRQSIIESDGRPMEEGAMVGYQKKVTVLYELLSACLADTPADSK